MNEFLDSYFLDNAVREYLIIAGIIVLTLFFKRYLSRYIAGLLFRLIKQIARGVDKPSFIRLVVSPLETFLVLLISIVSLDRLRFPDLLNIRVYKINLHELVDGLSVVILIVTFIWLILRIIDFIAMILNRKAAREIDQASHQMVVFFKDLFKVLFVIMGVLMILKMAFHYRISNLITALSIGSAALALAFRESLENLIASFIIFFDKPFMVGDLVKVQHITGTIEKIGLRSTRIRNDEKTFVTVPNKQMVDSIMDNLTLRTQRKAVVNLELQAGTSHDTMDRFIEQVKEILQNKKDKIESYAVFLSDINKNAFILHIEFFTAPIPVADFNAVRQAVNLAVIQLMETMQVKLAEPGVINSK